MVRLRFKSYQIANIQAAVVEAAADFVHNMEEKDARSSGNIHGERTEEGTFERIGKSLRCSNIERQLRQFIRAGGAGSGCDEGVAESHGTSCGPKAEDKDGKQAAPSGPVKVKQPKGGDWTSTKKALKQQKQYEKFQMKGGIRFLGLWKPGNASIGMYKTLMTGEWTSAATLKEQSDASQDFNKRFNALRNAGLRLQLFTIEYSGGGTKVRMVMKQVQDQARGQVGITSDVHQAALQAVQKLIGGQGLKSEVSKQVLGEYLNQVGLKNADLVAKAVRSWTNSPSGQSAQYLKRVASDYYGNDWSKEWKGFGGSDYAKDTSTFNYNELKEQAMAIKALSGEFVKASGMQYLYRGIKTDSAATQVIKSAINAGKAVEVPINSLTGFSYSQGTPKSFAGYDGIVIRVKVNPEDVWVASGALGHMFGGYTTDEKEYIVGSKTNKTLTLTPEDVMTSEHKPEWAKGSIKSASEETIQSEDTIREWMKTWVAYAEEGPSFDPTGKYLCGTCAVRIDNGKRNGNECAPMSGIISLEAGSCRMYIHGPDKEETKPYKHQLTQIEAQYGERPKTKRFGCSHCEYASKTEPIEGRDLRCSYFDVNVTKNACCAMNEGDDSVTPKEIEAGGPGSGRHKMLTSEVFSKDFTVRPKFPHTVSPEHTVEKMSIKDLTPTQQEISRDKAEGYRTQHKNIAINPLVKTLNGIHYVDDGHHRIASVVLNGKKSVMVHHENYDSPKAKDYGLKAAQEQSIDEGTLWNNIKIIGFTGPEEEALRAMISRVPPELLSNVFVIRSAKELDAKHGRYIPETKTVLFNPHNFLLRQRFGKGHGWIYHSELCVVHEIGHSIYESLSPQQKTIWKDLSGWMNGTQQGQAPAYVESRPGWPAGTSKWTHKAGIGFTRYYSERNPNEDFADSFAFVILGKGHQMEPSKKRFIDKYIKEHVTHYPSVSIESPVPK